jgi:hypothetical protein
MLIKKYYSSLCSDWKSILLLFSGVFIAFYPSLIEDYGYRDDYIAILWHSENFDWMRSAYMRDGRPLLAILVKIFFAPIDSVEDLKFLRMISVLGGFFLSLAVFQSLRFWGYSKAIGLLAGLGSATCLALTVYVGWTVCFSYSWASALAVLSGHCFAKAYFTNCRIFPQVLWAVLLLLISTSIYQAVAPLFFLIPCLAAWQVDSSRKKILFSFPASIVAFAAVCVLYLILYKISNALLYEGASRAAVGIDPWMKLEHLKTLIERLLQVNLVAPARPQSFLMAGTISLATIANLAASKKRKQGVLIPLSILFLLISVGFVPTLASPQYISGFRTDVS